MSPEGSAQVTLRHVAHHAGVSISMASRVLSGSRMRRDSASAAVLAAADELGYRPNLVARSLRAQQTRMVAMVVPAVSNPFFPQLIEAVARYVGGQGRTLLLADSCEDPELELRHVQALIDHRVDGLILVPVDAHESRAAADHASAHVTTVQLDRHVASRSGHVVAVDNFAGMRAVVQHVAGLGAQHLVFVSGGPSTSTGRERRQAFRDSVEEAGLRGREGPLGEFDVETGRVAARRLLADDVLPDAIICGADLIALGVIEELKRAGATVPRDTIVTGFDDISFATLSSPRLTTVRQPTDELAAVAVDALGTDGGPDQHVRLRPELVVRESCGADPGGGSVSGATRGVDGSLADPSDPPAGRHR